MLSGLCKNLVSKVMEVNELSTPPLRSLPCIFTGKECKTDVSLGKEQRELLYGNERRQS